MERTIIEINVHLFDNANDYMIKNNKVGKYQMTDRWEKINSMETLQCLLSIKYIAKHFEKNTWYKPQRLDEFKQIPVVTLHQQAQSVGNFCTDLWNQSEIESWYDQVFLTIPWVQ